ncbi:hypothetical protein PHPALM_31135 [Phytophthora palmivora]|uniref:Uncharacterized protein n=1 Tax=Phytophthora palmivora TaxID=4796 RepID=A0A2P4X3C3_9STRA|nr:hypothetical protein PHPALM_31135 [Phytophthora palmivora]
MTQIRNTRICIQRLQLNRSIPRYPGKCGQIEVLQLPRQKQRCNQRKRVKQSRLQTNAKPQNLATISLSDKNVHSLSRLLDWANETGDRYHVSEILENYPVIISDDFAGARAARSRREYVRNRDYDFNVVIPEYLVTKLDADVEAERRKRQKPTCLVDTDSDHPGDTTKEIIAYFPGGSPKFTRFVLLCPSVKRFAMLLVITTIYKMKELYSSSTA